ncbi:MAG: anthranilate synthase component I [Armatimonadota bacterium]|nr:anthranilate synthase component I [Armatimonadota bacterium]MDR5696611.1 anthranilate synthase component I [Armatimonadota bacterium]
MPTPRAYEAALGEGNLVPVSREIVADLETPVSAFLKIRDLPEPFLLESVEGGERLGRYSFLGARPRERLTYDGQSVRIEGAGSRTRPGPFLTAVREVLRPYRAVAGADLPRFAGGLVGYLGYDLVRDWEHLPARPPDDLGVPIAEMGLYDTVLAFDHVRRRIRIVAHAFAEEGAAAAYRAACERIDEMLERLHRPFTPQPAAGAPPAAVTSNLTRTAFAERVLRCKRYIRSGDVFQVVLSQRFAADIGALDSFLLYRAARAINPSPFLFYLEFGGARLAGSSPELLVRMADGEVCMRPIAGTRPRGADFAEDAALEHGLRTDEKERAEHVMLVDLARNDLGRISRYGSVRTTELMVVERYSHVMHMVSTVRGEPQPGRDAFDVLQAVFPHGTVTGAPKVRAMEIIDELEPVARGPYAGAVGYVGFDGTMDTCLAIRTFVIHGGTAYVQAGAGIVADSDPHREYEETVNKAKALLGAVELAGSGSL